MGWLSIDAVDGAFKRTKKALTEPFDFWKWVKLGIISILIGGEGGNFYTDGTNMPSERSAHPSIDEISRQVGQFWNQYMTLILIAVVFIIFLILLFGYISSVMEFVLVESLVTNTVAFWAYSRKYLRRGFNLFIIRLVLALFFLSLFIIVMYPAIVQFIELHGNIPPGLIFGAFVRFIAVVLAIAIVGGIIGSFINLSIPLSMYNGIGIIAAFKIVVGKSRTDWKQIIVYWVVRFILGLVVGIAVAVAAFILLVILAIILAIPAVILYFILSGLFGAGNILFWILMTPYLLIALIIIVLFLLMASAPAPVFMRYHLLMFLQLWYPDARIPFADE